MKGDEVRGRFDEFKVLVVRRVGGILPVVRRCHGLGRNRHNDGLGGQREEFSVIVLLAIYSLLSAGCAASSSRSAILSPSVCDMLSSKSVMPAATRMLYH